MYQPDCWRVLLINNSIVKIFAGWSGSYINSDCYRINSGTESIVEKECHYLVYGYSGSVYKLNKSAGHMNAYCQGVLNEVLSHPQIKEISIEEAIKFLKENN